MAVETLSNITQNEVDYSNFVIKSHLDYQCEMIQVRRWGIEEGMEIAREEDRQYFLELLEQDLTKEEIKERLRNN